MESKQYNSTCSLPPDSCKFHANFENVFTGKILLKEQNIDLHIRNGTYKPRKSP
jgi:hypothetical protein